MDAKTIRREAVEFVKLLEGKEPDAKLYFLALQSAVSAIYECAAQLAELNENLKPLIAVKATSDPYPY